MNLEDHVQLTTGGPIMTIQEVNNGRVKCQWFNGDKLEHAHFERHQLVVVSKDPKDKRPVRLGTVA